ncbi:MAG: cysteine--tRNA ligase [Dehalococcoidia bacterium]
MKIYNTLTARLEEFVPEGDEVKLYVCGVTPYDESHVGHALSYIVFDVLRRYLEYKGYRVRHVQNFTDIEDKLISRANQRGATVADLAERYIERYMEDMRDLNILPATVYPRATQEVPMIIEIIEKLMHFGYAYAAGGDVYYRVRHKPDYGKLSHRSIDSMIAESRVEAGEGKEFAGDFALWKGAKPGEPSWESPWGPGRPGWHIECTAMSVRYLGPSIDIHGGGNDLIFPHHENEIAQSEAATGVQPFVHYWMHNGWMQFAGEKMSKSLGNFVTIFDALRSYGADALRLFVLSSHYRSPNTYSAEGMEDRKKGAERLRAAAHVQSSSTLAAQIDLESYRRRMEEGLEDDLNTAPGIAALFDLAREINRARDEGAALQEAQALLRDLAALVGLTLAEPLGQSEAQVAAKPFIDLLIDVRRDLRTAKQFAVADQIRSRLLDLGIELEDSRDGTTWKPQS